jgi:hypothetical protein
MMPMGADPEAPTTEQAATDLAAVRDAIAVGALATFAVALTIAGFCISVALGFFAMAVAALVVALIFGLR